MELRVEVDGVGEPKALAELPSMRKDPRWHVTLALNTNSPHFTSPKNHVLHWTVSGSVVRWFENILLSLTASIPVTLHLVNLQLSTTKLHIDAPAEPGRVSVETSYTCMRHASNSCCISCIS